MTQKKKPASKPATRARVVYEVKGLQGVKQVDASSTAELKAALVPLLGLEPYSMQAAAHIAHVERATVQGNGWSIKRLGVLAFVPDGDTDAMPRRGPKKTEQRQEAGETTAPSLANSTEQLGQLEGQLEEGGGHHDHP